MGRGDGLLRLHPPLWEPGGFSRAGAACISGKTAMCERRRANKGWESFSSGSFTSKKRFSCGRFLVWFSSWGGSVSRRAVANPDESAEMEQSYVQRRICEHHLTSFVFLQ